MNLHLTVIKNTNNMQFYKYGNIVRILRHNPADISESLMIDVDMQTKQILSIFDGQKTVEGAFIQSFINILSQGTTGFTPIEEPTLQSEALQLANLSKD